jgi:DNA polymerase-1
MKKKRLVLIDGHSVLFRAYHAYPPLTTSKGELINAVYGFTNILLTTVRELKPTHLAVTFDLEKPTFRHKEFEGYKAHREEMPVDLANQQGRVEEVLKVLRVPVYAIEGYEADDVIGTLACQLKAKGGVKREKVNEVMIVTGDLDALQLVESDGPVKVHVYVPGRGKKPTMIYDEVAVEERYGLEPEQLVDFKALAGDASDEIPGVKGVGSKTAVSLLTKFKTVEEIYKSLARVRKEFGERVAGLLTEGRKEALMSKKLAKIVTQVPIKLDLKSCRLHEYDRKKAVQLFKELQFKSLIKKLPNDKFEQMVQDTLV